MRFPQPLTPGVLVQRYKRFFADVVLDDGRSVTAHCPNPGAMLGLNIPGQRVWLSPSDNPKRSLAWTLEIVEDAQFGSPTLAGVNTLTPNRIVAEALAADAIPELIGYASVRREVKYGEASRVDFLLSGPDRPAAWLEVKDVQRKNNVGLNPEHRFWVEVKNVHLRRTPGLAEFPDCVAARSTKHLRELEAMVAQGDRAAVVFVVQREDCDAFSACQDLDPKFAAALDHAADGGVEVLVYACGMTVEGIKIERRISWAR